MTSQFLSASIQDINQFVSISVKMHRETFEADNDPIEFERYISQAFNPEELKQLLEDQNC